MRQRITEAQLHRIVKESVKNVLIQEGNGFTDTIKGAFQGARRGDNNIFALNSTLHTVSAALSSACQYFGQIHSALSKNNVQGAMQICMQAYQECKTALNSTYANGQNITSQYGAQLNQY